MLASAVLATASPALAATGPTSSGGTRGPDEGAGHFKEPSGVAVNETTGDTYVVDKGNNRVVVLNSSGAFEHQFNGTEVDGTTSGAGREAPATLSEPGAIAVDNSCALRKLSELECDAEDPSNGDVYVADTGHNVIDKFSRDGAYIGQLAGGGHPFSAPLGVTVDTRGSVWVNEPKTIDTFSNAVDNALVAASATSFVMSAGIAVDTQSHAYVLTLAHNLAKVDNEGSLLASPSECGCVTAVAADPATDRIFVDEATQVTEYTPSGAPFAAFGAGELVSGSGVAVSSSTDAVYVADSSLGTLWAFEPARETAEREARERAEQEAREHEQAEREAAREAEAEAIAKAQAEAAANKRQEEVAATAATERKHGEEAAAVEANAKAGELASSAGTPVSIAIVKVAVSTRRVTIVLRSSQAGRVMISGPKLRRTAKNVVAGSIQIKIALTKPGRIGRTHPKRTRITVKLEAAGKVAYAARTIRL